MHQAGHGRQVVYDAATDGIHALQPKATGAQILRLLPGRFRSLGSEIGLVKNRGGHWFTVCVVSNLEIPGEWENLPRNQPRPTSLHLCA
jgi:hypothetical protein